MRHRIMRSCALLAAGLRANMCFSAADSAPSFSNDMTVQAFTALRGNNDIHEPGVPEPTIWGTIVVGFGMLGTAMRRRRKAQEAFA